MARVPPPLRHLPVTVPGLWRKQLIDGAGHFVQQERPRIVNEILLEFLRNGRE